MSGGKLPEGWQTSSIGDLCKKVTDGSHNPPKASEVGLPMLSAKNINNGSIVFSETHRIISEAEFWEENKRTSIESGDVLLTIVGTLGRTAVVPQDFTPFTLQRSVAVLSTSELEPSYFRYALENREFQIQIHENSKGTAQKGIYLNALKKLTINIAPKNEQKIIAEKLDTLLAQVDSTKARLEQIPQILKRFRQAVLAGAVTGRLTKENNDYTKKTIELDNYKISIPKKWTETILNNVINTQRPLCYGVVQPGDDINDGIELIRVCDINDGEVDLNHLRKISKEIDIQYKRSKVQKNDILVTIVGAIGRIGIVREDINVNIARAVARVSPECKLIKPMFLHIWLSSPVMQTWLVQSSKEVARKTLNLKDLKEAFVPLPSIEEQHEIVRRVEQLFAWADTIEKQVNNALNRVNSLTQSILAKAFRGELTAQWRAENPDLISGENSAAALLEKIKAERAASGGKKTSRKKS
ncbi:restriction endonuclease subunit S [Citrobacter sp. Cpo147]|uniref:restriction endonuclease subunit S n=1 Tax=Citrobacter sp. Cpo147 TaxID=2985152 RepID=UPI0025762D52|nr:restriction endonuclease subunit S [Citrobacter sp. Cpo147]MDM2770845.1 restriction endonuclease subunit S [Citrobacter sp. Cpo147]